MAKCLSKYNDIGTWCLLNQGRDYFLLRCVYILYICNMNDLKSKTNNEQSQLILLYQDS